MIKVKDEVKIKAGLPYAGNLGMVVAFEGDYVRVQLYGKYLTRLYSFDSLITECECGRSIHGGMCD